jgi:hypothetical protein
MTFSWSCSNSTILQHSKHRGQGGAGAMTDSALHNAAARRSVRSWHNSDIARCPTCVRYALDCVAKVVLQEVSKILRAAGAFFV